MIYYEPYFILKMEVSYPAGKQITPFALEHSKALMYECGKFPHELHLLIRNGEYDLEILRGSPFYSLTNSRVE